VEETLEVRPLGNRHEGVVRLFGLFEHRLRDQAGALGEGDEEHAIQDLLRRLKGLKQASARPPIR
jgi:hypothetical protein